MIYVDTLTAYGPEVYRGKGAAQARRVSARNGNVWCHLFSDEQDREFPELHAFAKKIGMLRDWFQGDHYDLVSSRRRQAVALGAKEVSRREAVEILRARCGP